MKRTALALIASTATIVQAQPVTEDARAWARREPIEQDQHVGGSLAGFLFGFGLGQAMQGRWHDRGWLFTVGDGAAMSALMVGAFGQMGCYGLTEDGRTRCTVASVAAIAGFSSLMILRVWQTVDAVYVPYDYNRRILRARAKLRFAGPYLAPPQSGDGATAGLVLTF